MLQATPPQSLEDKCKPPKWENEAAVADWVIEVLGFTETAQRLYQKLLPAVRSALQKPTTNPAQVFDVPVSDVADLAVADAERGNFRALGALVGMNAALPEKARKLIQDRLDGIHKVKRGRPKMDEWERRLFVPVHGAAIDFRFIKQVLTQAYPEQPRRQIHERALSIAACRRGIEPDKLDYHLKRSKKDRRRLPI